MVTIHRSGGFRIVIYLNDHEPAHVHVVNADGEAKINLFGTTGGRPELVSAIGLKSQSIREAMRIVEANANAFLERWREIHG